MKDSFLSRNEALGFIAGIAPFFASCSSLSSRSVNGRVIESSYFDMVAVIGGGIAALIALGILLQLDTTAPEDKVKRLGIFVVMLALGVFQVLRGFGVVG